MLKYMLDTNIVIYTMKNKPASVRAAFKKHDGRMYISSIYTELIYGAERSSNPERNLASLEGFVARMDVLPLDDSAAGHMRGRSTWTVWPTDCRPCPLDGVGVGD